MCWGGYKWISSLISSHGRKHIKWSSDPSFKTDCICLQRECGGTCDLAPFSFFTAISADPMLVCFSPMRRGTDGGKKDTLLNIEATKEFVINIVSEAFVEQMNDCAKEYAPEVDEFEAAGLGKKPSVTVAPPAVSESRVQLECTLQDVLHFGDHPGAGSLVIGKVQCVRLDDELYDAGRIDSPCLSLLGGWRPNLHEAPRRYIRIDPEEVREK